MTKSSAGPVTPLTKAQYRPLTSRATHSRRSSKTGNLTDNPPTPENEEAHEGQPQRRYLHPTTSHGHGSSIQRLTYTAPKDPDAAKSLESMVSYLTERSVIDNMERFTQLLTKRENVLYNPYPVLAKQFMPLAEKCHMIAEDDASVRSKVQHPLQSTTSDLIWGLQGCSNVWGLKSMVQVVDPDHVMNVQRIMEKSSSRHELIEKDGYSGQLLVSVVRSLSLMGSFHSRPLTLDVRLEYLIYGEDVNEGLDIFANSVAADIEEHLNDATASHLLYVTFTVKTGQSDGTKVEMRWSKKRIHDQREDFKKGIIETMNQRGGIKAEVIFHNQSESESSPALLRGSKEYILHFIKISSQGEGESLISFGEFPYQTLVEGVFLKKADAEAYISAMKRHPVNPGSGLPKKLSRRVTKKSGDQMMMMTSSSKPRTDGLVEVIRKPLRLHFMKLLGGLSEVPGCYTALHSALVLILIDRNKYKLETLVSIYRFLQSTSTKFYVASQLNQTIIDFIQSEGVDAKSHPMLLSLLNQYKKDVLRIFDPSLHKRPHQQMAYHSYFSCFMNDMERLLSKDPLPDARQVIRRFLEFEMFCNTVQYQLTEEALANLENFNLKYFISDCEEQLSVMASKDSAPTGNDSPVKNSHSDQRLLVKHGIEPADIMQQRLKYLPVQSAVERTNHPAIMAREGVIMQYLLDVRLDEVWGGYLRELMISDYLPSNPYPALVTALRRAAYRMQLCGNRDNQITQTLLSVTPRLADARLSLYTLPQSGVYGYKSALRLTDQDKLKKALQLTDAISDSDVISQKGKFQISSGISLTGRSVFYGKMAPYLLKLEAHHYFYIKGPLGSNSEALQLFSRLVSEDILSLKKSSNSFILVGLYMDGQEVASMDGLIDQINVSAIVLDAASRKLNLYIKFYQAVGWRYVPIIKHYRLHFLFVDNADDRHEAYYRGHPADEHWYMFLSAEEATEFVQNCSKAQTEEVIQEKLQSLDERQTRCIKEHRLLMAYECYLVKCLLQNNLEPLPDIWRVFHSPAAQVEYLIQLCESISDLVMLSLKIREAEEAAAPSPPLQETRGKSKKGNPRPVKPTETKGKINLRTLFKMAQAFHQKLEDTLSEPTLFAPACLSDVIEAKMQLVLHLDTSTVVIDLMSIISLEEIQHLLKPLLIGAASEADSVSKKPLLTNQL